MIVSLFVWWLIDWTDSKTIILSAGGACVIERNSIATWKKIINKESNSILSDCLCVHPQVGFHKIRWKKLQAIQENR